MATQHKKRKAQGIRGASIFKHGLAPHPRHRRTWHRVQPSVWAKALHLGITVGGGRSLPATDTAARRFLPLPRCETQTQAGRGRGHIHATGTHTRVWVTGYARGQLPAPIPPSITQA
jgi:hypothetical protein